MRRFPELHLHSEWVEKTFQSLTREQKIGQVLHPCLFPNAGEDFEKVSGGVEIGGMFLFHGTREQFVSATKWLKARSQVPMIISSDLENGAGMMVKNATIFPDLMALGAANDEELAYAMGKAAALEGRECGIHWAFGPVVDINANPHNPITSTRCLGDDPERIARLSKAMIRGMQEHGLAATAKHFPGGGFDDRDQHLCNTINPLSLDQWHALSGRMFQEAIDLGVWSIMVGHISLPACDSGDGTHIQMGTPASLSDKIINVLLRDTMGFQGVVITDAMDMAGVTAWGKREEIIPAAIAAGCDMILFAEVKKDFDILQAALGDGRLTWQQLDMAVRRILALKEVLELHENTELPTVTDEDRKVFRQTSEAVSEKAITIVKDTRKTLPINLEKGSHVLSYHFHNDPECKIEKFDELLCNRGGEVSHFDDSDTSVFSKNFNSFEEYDAIIVNAVLCPAWGTGDIRPGGIYMRDVWALITSHHPRLILISWGSPYLGYEMPHVPCIINAYSPDENTQRAVVKILSGELTAVGTSPVDLEAPYYSKELVGKRYF